MWVVLVLCFSLDRVAGYLYIYLPAYLCAHVIYISGAVHAFVSVRPTARRMYGGANRTATSWKLHPPSKDRIQPRNNPAGILSGIPHWNDSSPRAGNLYTDKCIVIIESAAAGCCFIAMLMITLKRLERLTRSRHGYYFRELSLKPSRRTKCLITRKKILSYTTRSKRKLMRNF